MMPLQSLEVIGQTYAEIYGRTFPLVDVRWKMSKQSSSKVNTI